MKRQVIYISGAYRSRYGVIGRLINIWKARRAAVELARQGYCVFCPHLNWGLFDGHREDEFWLKCGLKMLPKAQIIYMLKGWGRSEGAKSEYQMALKRGLKVIFQT